MSKKADDIIRNFGMANQMAEVTLDSVERKYSIDLGRPKQNTDKDTKYYPQFEEAIRNDASKMAKHYETFYCLEHSIRLLISQRLKEFGDDWWDAKIPENIKVEAKKRHKKEVAKGITPRSYELLDYTDFGELSTIIINNWDIFGDMLTDKDAVRNVMTMLNMLRGPIAHCGYLREDEVTRLHMTLADWFRLME